jgi:MSHA biogenesis protein MshJ
MKLWWQDLIDRVDAFSLRERVLVLIALLAVTAVIWDGLLMRPLDRQSKRLQPEVASLREEVERINRTVQELGRQESQADPNRAVQEQVTAARGGLDDLNQQLGGLTRGLIAPEEMVEVLEQVLTHTAPLELLSLRTLPAEPLAALVPGEVLPSQLYRHGVEVQLSGTYLELLGFLREMEKLHWRFYWQSLELEVEEHPRLRVKLTAYTLGQEEAWIGA